MKFLVLVFAVFVAASAVKTRFNSRFQRQQVPHTVYGPPPQEYGPPPQEYGPPAPETTTQEQTEATTTEVPTTTNGQAETVNTTTSGRLTKGNERGVYYIYHPTGQLQKVVYTTKKDSKNQAFTAQLKYEDVEPIRAPIFTYDPKTLVLTRFQP